MKAEFDTSLKETEYSRKDFSIDIKEGSGRKGEDVRKGIRLEVQTYRIYWLGNTASIKNNVHTFYISKWNMKSDQPLSKEPALTAGPHWLKQEALSHRGTNKRLQEQIRSGPENS